MIDKKIKYRVFLNTLGQASGYLAIALFAYLILLPLWPIFRLELLAPEYDVLDYPSVSTSTAKQSEQGASLPKNEVSPDAKLLSIPKIGVLTDIVESYSESALEKGAWLDLRAKRPGDGGNVVISAHRFKYLPPNNLTFYLLHKLEKGDRMKIYWQGQEFTYEVTVIRRTTPDDASVLAQDGQEELTLYTCDPIYSQEKRLVIETKQIVP